MSYDPTEPTQQSPGSSADGQPPQPSAQPPQPAQPLYGQPQLPPMYGQPPQPSAQPPLYGQPPQPSAQPPLYGQPPMYGQPPQQPTQPPLYGQPQQPTQPPMYGQQQPMYGQGNPSFPSSEQASQSLARPMMTPPAYGQGSSSSPTYPQYAPPTAETPYAPLDPYAAAQAQPGQPWGGGMPATPVPAKKSRRGAILITVLILIILIGGGVGGAVYYISTRPQPLITLTSSYKVGSTYAGTNTTTFNVAGHKFSGNSVITFLLDGAPAPGNEPAQSDTDGNVTATLIVTNNWSNGDHTITARDASSYLTEAGVHITIVAPGQAGTPGPFGAPPDNSNGTIAGNIRAGDQTEAVNLTVTGSASGGTVCASDGSDNGQPQNHTGSSDGVAYTETIVQTCSGTYQGGKLTYTETVTSDKAIFADGLVCIAKTPYVQTHLEGAFTSATSVSGSFSQDAVDVTCTLNGKSEDTPVDAITGTWSGIWSSTT